MIEGKRCDAPHARTIGILPEARNAFVRCLVFISSLMLLPPSWLPATSPFPLPWKRHRNYRMVLYETRKVLEDRRMFLSAAFTVMYVNCMDWHCRLNCKALHFALHDCKCHATFTHDSILTQKLENVGNRHETL